MSYVSFAQYGTLEVLDIEFSKAGMLDFLELTEEDVSNPLYPCRFVIEQDDDYTVVTFIDYDGVSCSFCGKTSEFIQ